jgi:hypothetical protein
MKTLETFLRQTALLGLTITFATATPVTQPTPVHVAASADAAVIKVVPAGTILAPAPEVAAPAGWRAVQLPPPHDVFVENRSITKDMSVSTGAGLRLQPEGNAITLTTAREDDALEITGLRGRWTQLRLNRPVVGYIATATIAPGAATLPPSPRVASTPVSDRPVAPATSSASPLPRPLATPPAAPATSLDALPRTFEGVVVSTRAPLRPRRPYDFALEDRTGNRLGYLDISRLMLTSPMEDYIGRQVVVYGPARTVTEAQGLVIRVESLQLR